MRFNPDIYHRHTIRLKGHDYSQHGYYFVTICTQGKWCLFGKIEEKQMVFNDSGKMISRWWNELKNKFTNVEIDDYVIMPNHCHGIINIVDSAGADRCTCPDNNMGEHTGSPLQERPISEVIKWFKTMTTNEYIRNVKQNYWQPFDGKLWQRNYYEQIIRDEASLQRVREYINMNPLQWQQDKLFAE
jgi:putative transposase